MRSTLIGLSGFSLAVVLLAGCVGLSTVAPGDTAYVHQRIETALATSNCIKSMVILNQNGRCLIITLKVLAATEEVDCLKAMRALSLDPSIPEVDEVCVCAKQIQDIKMSRRLVGAAFSGGVQGAAGIKDVSVPQQGQEEVTSFSCKATRAALLKGEAPTIVLRNKVFVSGPYQGQSTDDLWLHENKK